MRVLIHRARDQEMSHVEPFLRLAPRPEGGYRKEVLDLIKVGLVEADLTQIYERLDNLVDPE
jgi:hypothetical protein